MDSSPDGAYARPASAAPVNARETEPGHKTEERQLQTGPLFLLAGAHALNDSYTAFLSNLLPLLMDKFGLTYALAGMLQSVLSVSTSLAQPIFGILTDRNKRVPFIILGPAITAIAISSMGIMPSYGWLYPALIIGGLSTAAFHPQATSVVPLIGGSRRGVGMALFVAGGSIGYSLGPVYILLIIGAWGLELSWVAAIPALVLVAVLFPQVPRTAHGFAVSAVETASSAPFMRHWKALLLMWLVVVLRSGVATTYTGFLPTYLHDVRGFTVGFQLGESTALGHLLFSGMGAVGGLVAGYLSDVISRRMVISVGLLLAAPVLLALLHVGGWWVWPLLIFGGGLVHATNPVMVIMAQELVPGSGGTAAGVMMGLGWAVGALVVPVVGGLADQLGLTTALSLTVGLLLVGVVLALFVPEPKSM